MLTGKVLSFAGADTTLKVSPRLDIQSLTDYNTIG
jgi:hypothetical protein